jgi:hypothetical protein
MMRLQLMLMREMLKIVRSITALNSSIWAVIALLLANQIARIAHDFEMNMIIRIIAYLTYIFREIDNFVLHVQKI